MKQYTQRRLAGQRGISIIEQLITLVVMSTAVLGVTKYQASLFSAELNSKQRAEAVSLAQQQLEILKSTGYDVSASSGQDASQGSTVRFVRTWSVSPDTDLAYDRASVVVTWMTNGQNNSASLDSRIANAPPASSGRYMLGELGSGATGSLSATPASSGSQTYSQATLVPTPTPVANELAATDPGTAASLAAGPTSETTSSLPVSCACSRSRHGQTYTYAITPGQHSSCTIAICSAAPGQCAPANDTSCNYTATLSR
jgi:Tfp pilus assembly protein PilV